MMYLMAGLVIERVTKDTWENAVQKRILTPLKMNNTNFSVIDLQKANDYSMPYQEKDNEIQQIPFRNIDNDAPAGSINSSISDMAKWVQLQLSDGKKLITKHTLEEIHTLQIANATYPSSSSYSLGYALGWGIVIYKNYYCVLHTGGIDGFISCVTLFPEKGIGIVVLSNSSSGGGDLVPCITNTIADLLLGCEKENWFEKIGSQRKERLEQENVKKIVQSTTTPSHPLKEYIGTYEHPGYGTVEIKEKDGKLVALYNNMNIPLDHTQYDVFSGSKKSDDEIFIGMNFSFINDATGQIYQLQIPLEATVKPIVFQKKQPKDLLSREYLKQFEGRYEAFGNVVEVQLRGKQLVMIIPGQEDLKLYPKNPLEFSTKMPDFNVRFLQYTNGKIIELLQVVPNAEIRYKKKL